MKYNTSSLSDDELKYIVKQYLQVFLEPIKLNSKKYMKYNALLGTKKKNSIMVQNNLPGIALELYYKYDQAYVKLMEKIVTDLSTFFIDNMRGILGDDATESDIIKSTDEQIARYVEDFIKSNNNGESLDMDLLWIQMKLAGLPNVDERKNNILKLCGEEVVQPEIKEGSTEEQENAEVAEQPAEVKTIVEKKKPKQKKLTAEEKAAKTKAANEKKEKAKKEAIKPTEDDENVENNDMEEPVEEISTPYMSVEELKKKLEDELVPKYVGIIKTIQNYYNNTPYYNFTPIGKIEDGEFYPFSQNELDDLLPKSTKCNINFYYNQWDEGQVSFMNEKFYEGQLVVLHAEIDDLEENRAADGTLNPTGYKVPAIDGYKKKTIKKLSDIELYTVLSRDNLLDDYRSKKSIRINGEELELMEGDKVLVNLGDGFYAGPFKVNYSKMYAHFHINMEQAEGKRFTAGYNSSDCVRVVIEPQPELEYRIGGYNSWTYYEIRKNAKPVLRDYITDKDLLDSFKTALEKSGGLDYSNLDIDGIVEKLGDSLIIGKDIPEEIKKQRIERISAIMSSEERLMEVCEDSSELLLDLLLKNKDSEKVGEFLSEIISQNPAIIEKIQGIRTVQEKVDSARAELQQLEEQKSQIEAEFKSIRDESDNSKNQKIDFDEALTGELAEKKAELEETLSKIKDAKQAVALQESIDKLKEEVEYYEKHKTHLLNDSKDLESNFVELINGYSEKIADIAFDGFMSSKMLQAASGWDKKEEIDELARRVTTLNVVEKDMMGKDELIDYIVSKVKISRPSYGKNTIINILTCITQGFLTVFSGSPGCGKTSICNIVSRVLGLSNYGRISSELKGVSRYIQVSVERGWTSKRDFIGYYNPLTKDFEESNREVYDALQLLDMESRNEYVKWPFFILLDEANLSSMEYYWADFMNVCDDLSDNSVINLGNDNIFKVPETLHFLATINNDHTTETLSPRLIDRAWIITLPKVNVLQENEDVQDEQIRTVSWDELMNVFSPKDDEKRALDRESQLIFDGIKDKLMKQEIYLSPRVRIAIEKYWLVASKLMEGDDYRTSPSIIALDYAVAQRILPKLMGSGEEYEAFLEDLKKFCDEKNLSYTTELLESMINRGNRQMKYYQFFN